MVWYYNCIDCARIYTRAGVADPVINDVNSSDLYDIDLYQAQLRPVLPMTTDTLIDVESQEEFLYSEICWIQARYPNRSNANELHLADTTQLCTFANNPGIISISFSPY